MAPFCCCCSGFSPSVCMWKVPGVRSTRRSGAAIAGRLPDMDRRDQLVVLQPWRPQLGEKNRSEHQPGFQKPSKSDLYDLSEFLYSISIINWVDFTWLKDAFEIRLNHNNFLWLCGEQIWSCGVEDELNAVTNYPRRLKTDHVQWMPGYSRGTTQF